MKIAIIDDEQIFLKQIEERVIAICNNNNFEYDIKCYGSPTRIPNDEDFAEFDVVLLDIDMPGINGIELASKINKRRRSITIPYIIFVTAMDNMVFEALEQFPYSFVRKTHLEDIDKCILNIHKMRTLSPVYSVKIGRTTKLIELDKTIYLEKQGNYVNFYTTEGIFQERSLIDDKYNALSQFGFIRPHVGAIANANYITEFNNSFLRLRNGKEMSISRTYKREVTEKYHEWLVRMK